jgi:m7GpppX diphosphatase
MLRETPEAYASAVEPYISSFPPERTAWVHAILEGRKEAERVIFRDEDKENGFVILPDLKWDGTTLAALYLTTIVQDASIRSMRDLRRKHIPLLRAIRAQAYASAKEGYGVEEGDLRLFIHYQPSYCELTRVQREAKLTCRPLPCPHCAYPP